MGLRVCTVVLIVVYIFLPDASGKIMNINEYFPDIHREISKVTWAHAVNSHEKLKEALADPYTMMLEADILMGTHNNFEDIQPIMAHPPHKSSDLTFVQFLEAVLTATKSEGRRKGIKLDFKDLDAVEPCLKILKTRLNDPESPSIPVFVNADILQGPVNSTKKPINPELFISLAKEYAPSATLSVGWTTRYGTDDPEDEIREGKYTKLEMKEMLKVLRISAGDPPVFPHITFPVRAGIAAQSIDELLYLTSRVRTESSITIWSPKTDPVNRQALQSLIHQMTSRHCFIDLPFSMDDQDDDADAEVIDADPSAIQQLEGRGQSEGDNLHSSASSTFLPASTLLSVIAIGLLTSLYIFNRRQ